LGSRPNGRNGDIFRCPSAGLPHGGKLSRLRLGFRPGLALLDTPRASRLTFGIMRSMRNGTLLRHGFAAWLLLTTLVCLNPGEAGPHLYGAHEGTSDHNLTRAESFGSSAVITSVLDQACDDEVAAIVPAKVRQDVAAHLPVVAPDTTADAADGESQLIVRIVRVSDSPPGDPSRIVPLRI
jgi:hypothetical protein